MEKVWYASYGSNLFRERFLCYIEGTKFSRSNRKEQGCKDKTLPLDEKNIIINNELYFSEKSIKWNHYGVGFINKKKNPNIKTYGKMYLISKEQFEDIIKQENLISVYEHIQIDYKQLDSEGQFVLFPNRYYGRILKVCDFDGIPVYTFTNPNDDIIDNPPSKKYLKTIFTGILTNYHASYHEIIDNFIHLNGIKGVYTREDLEKIITTSTSL